MAARMDAATIKKMGKTALINGITYDVISAELLEEMGPLRMTRRAAPIAAHGRGRLSGRGRIIRHGFFTIWW